MDDSETHLWPEDLSGEMASLSAEHAQLLSSASTSSDHDDQYQKNGKPNLGKRKRLGDGYESDQDFNQENAGVGSSRRNTTFSTTLSGLDTGDQSVVLSALPSPHFQPAPSSLTSMPSFQSLLPSPHEPNSTQGVSMAEAVSGPVQQPGSEDSTSIEAGVDTDMTDGPHHVNIEATVQHDANPVPHSDHFEHSKTTEPATLGDILPLSVFPDTISPTPIKELQKDRDSTEQVGDLLPFPPTCIPSDSQKAAQQQLYIQQHGRLYSLNNYLHKHDLHLQQAEQTLKLLQVHIQQESIYASSETSQLCQQQKEQVQQALHHVSHLWKQHRQKMRQHEESMQQHLEQYKKAVPQCLDMFIYTNNSPLIVDETQYALSPHAEMTLEARAKTERESDRIPVRNGGEATPQPTPPPPASLEPGPGDYTVVQTTVSSYVHVQHVTVPSSNLDLRLFLVTWANDLKQHPRPTTAGIERLLKASTARVQYEDLGGDKCDFQGIDWTGLGVTRREARDYRKRTYHNHVNAKGSDQWTLSPRDRVPWNPESYFRFRRMHIRKFVYSPHFQLRNTLACTSPRNAFIADRYGCVQKVDALTGKQSLAMKFSEEGTRISVIAADQGVLVAGGCDGEYGILNLNSDYLSADGETTPIEGTLSDRSPEFSTHIEIHSLRNAAGPQATIASNDLGVRLLDLQTQKIRTTMYFPFVVNCTAISPDGRMRVVVGDADETLIVSAEPERMTRFDRDAQHAGKAEVLATLKGHRDFCFSCAWAPDGYTVATGSQDRAVQIWDARRLHDVRGQSTPVATLPMEMAGARSLRFSPAGAGRRVLVAAEEADFVNVIDAVTFRSRQTLDTFGEIAGTSFTTDGQALMVLSADRVRGGLLHFERCDLELSLTGTTDMEGEKLWEPDRLGSGRLDWEERRYSGETRWQRFSRQKRQLRQASTMSMNPF